MPSVVRFVDHSDVEVVVPGKLLPLALPDGLRVHRIRTAGSPELMLKSDRATTKFAGRLDIPYVTDGGAVDVAHLDVPPPVPWRWGDVAAMRAAASRLRLADPAGSSGLRQTEDARWLPASNVAWMALTRCSATARRLLVRWPSRTNSRVVSAPLEQPRGTELIDATESRLGIRIDLLRSGERVAPEVSIRRVGMTVPWTNRTLAAVAHQATRALRLAEAAGVLGEVPRTLTAPITALARLAQPPAPVADPPFSSWPPPFVDAYIACLDLLSSISVGGSKSGWVPLSDLWRLYELWLGERMLAILSRLMGPPSRLAGADDERIAVGWAGGSWELELRHPCAFTNNPREIVGSSWWSVSSRLDPDVGLLARSSAGTRCVLLDAKDRPRLTPGDVAAEASKYQWGIRRNAAPTLGVNAVILVSPYGGDEPYDRLHARHWVIHAHPNAPQLRAPGEIGMDLNSSFVRELLEAHLLLPPDAFIGAPWSAIR